jgi:outer membrane protein TolC
MTENRDLAASAARLEADREELAIARASLLPQIDLSATGTILDEDRALAAMRPPERSITAGAELNQVIYSEAAWTAYTAEKRLLEQREAVYEQDRLDVALSAANAYFQVLRAKTSERLQKANLQLSRQNLERARVRVQLGDANRSEEYRWTAKIANEKAELIASIAARNVAEMELNRTLNQPLEEPILLSEPDLDAQLSLMLDPRIAHYLGDAWHLRLLRRYVADYARRVSPELLQITAGIGAQERVLTGRKRSFFLPDIGLNLGWRTYLEEKGAGSEGRPDGFPDDEEWNASLAVSLPLFQGARRFAETRQAGQDLLTLRLQYQATDARIEQRVRSAVHRASASKAAIDLSHEAAVASRQNFELVSDSYSRGAIDLITLLDAQNAYLNAELAAADAIYGFLLDLMELERSVGRFTYFATIPQREAWLADLEAWFATQEN